MDQMCPLKKSGDFEAYVTARPAAESASDALSNAPRGALRSHNLCTLLPLRSDAQDIVTATPGSGCTSWQPPDYPPPYNTLPRVPIGVLETNFSNLRRSSKIAPEPGGLNVEANELLYITY